MQHIQQALARSPGKDGVDGSKIYFYGEGWNFGDTANNQIGPNASQVNLYGYGIGTFNDRIRDGIRGGGPFPMNACRALRPASYRSEFLHERNTQHPINRTSCSPSSIGSMSALPAICATTPSSTVPARP